MGEPPPRTLTRPAGLHGQSPTRCAVPRVRRGNNDTTLLESTPHGPLHDGPGVELERAYSFIRISTVSLLLKVPEYRNVTLFLSGPLGHVSIAGDTPLKSVIKKSLREVFISRGPLWSLRKFSALLSNGPRHLIASRDTSIDQLSVRWTPCVEIAIHKPFLPSPKIFFIKSPRTHLPFPLLLRKHNN